MFLLVLLGLALAGAPAAAADLVGLYWDAGYSQDETTVEPVPGLVTGYLVMKDVTDPGGVLGWELCLDLEGRAMPVSVSYGGDAINLAEPPCFVVGLAAPTPPIGADVLLATCEFLVTDTRPIRITAGPTETPSLPGVMAWIPAGAPEDLLPLGTVSGSPQIATINADNPWYEISASSLDFGEVAVGAEAVQWITIRNAGFNPLPLDIALSAGCEGFVLTAAQGGLTLAPGASQLVGVGFAPTAIQPYACDLLFGPGIPPVPLQGSGREPVTSYTVSSIRYFGEVAIGAWRDLSSVIRNTGEVPLPVAPSLVGCGPDYSIVSGGDPQELAPNQLLIVNVRFAPTVAGTLSCALSYGPGYDETPLTGTGRELDISYAVTGHMIFGEVPLGGFVDRSVTITNTGADVFPVAPALLGCNADLQITSGTTAALLGPGGSRTISVRFEPTAFASVACSLSLGPVVPTVDVLAATRATGLVIAAPDSVDFGDVEAGQTSAEWVFLRNNDSVSFRITPTLLGCLGDFTITAGGGTRTLTAGQNFNVQVTFHPDAAGDYACALGLGDFLPQVALAGTATAPVPRFTITPTEVAFEATAPGSWREATVRIQNTGTVPFDVAPALTGDPEFSLTTGALPAQVLPGTTRVTTLRFAPGAYGTYTGEFSFGEAFPPVALVGTCADVIESCEVSVDQLDFGTVTVGETRTRSFTVLNSGNVNLNLAPSAAPSAFTVTPSPFTLAPGAAQECLVSFRPLAESTFSGQIQLGSGACPAITVLGQGEYPDLTGANELGFFFDEAFTLNQIDRPPVSVTDGYLVLRDAGSFDGVSGWECRLEVFGTAFRLSTTFPTSAINVGLLPDYVVGFATPLPWTHNIVLAHFQYLNVDTNPVFFVAGPTTYPSIPGQMAWVDGTGDGLFPMFPITGDPILAVMNDSSPVGIGAPTPQLQQSGGQVELDWQLTAAVGDRCHVYRRADDGPAERLTADPLAGAAGAWSYTDQPVGFAPGTHLFYSYAVVRDGIERARSPEVEVVLSGLPVRATHLLPNVPNPFNPRTEVRFELAEAGRARVVVYDITGRVVKVLQDGHLEPGAWSRTWQGRDEAGRQVASGAYYVRLEVGGHVDHRKIMLLK